VAVGLAPRVVTVAKDGVPHLVFCEAPARKDYRFTVVDLSPVLQSDFREVAQEAAEPLVQDQAPIAYAATDRPPESQYAVLDSAADPGSWALLQPTLLAGLKSAINYAVLADADLEKVRPSFYLIVSHLEDDVVLFGRATQPRNIPKKSMRISAVFREGVLQRVEEELILFDSNVDWIFWKDVFYIINSAQFERIFIDRERLTGQVKANLGAITQIFNIAGQDDLELRCAGNLNMAVKLQRIIDRGKYQNWTVAQLKAYAQKYQPAIQWQGSAIVFDGSPAHQWDILKLLDEAWFTGELSQDHFEATAKVEA